MSVVPLSRLDSVASAVSMDEAVGAEVGVAPELGASMPPPAPAERDLLEQTTRLDVDLEREALVGTTELRVRLPTSPPLTSLRLNCASQCRIDGATLDGKAISWRQADDEANAEQVVPPRWKRTRDLNSYRSVHGKLSQSGRFCL